MKCECHHCGKVVEISLGQYNYRVVKNGLNVYCNKQCSYLGRRSWKNLPEEQRKLIKYFYDSFIYLADPERFKRESHDWFKKDYAKNPEKYRQQRIKRRKEHAEYCRQPEYKKWKQKYDQRYRAKKLYGKFWESAIALRELGNIVDNRQAKADQKSINKTQNRKRYANKDTKRKELERCSMGLYQPS